MKRLVIAVVLLLNGCKKESTATVTTKSDAATEAAASEVREGWTIGKAVRIEAEGTPAALEEIGDGSWIVFGPRGDTALYGDLETTTLWPQKQSLRIAKARGGRFSPEGDKALVWTVDYWKRATTTTVFATTDLHTILTLDHAEDPFWTTRGTVAFVRGGQLYEVAATTGATPKLVGPPTPLTERSSPTEKRRAAPDLSYVIVASKAGAKKIDLATGKESYLVKGDETPALASDGTRACTRLFFGKEHYNVVCGPDEVLVTTVGEQPTDLGFLSPTKIWIRFKETNELRVADLATKTLSPLVLPVPAGRLTLTALPGDRFAIVHEHYETFDRPRGIVDFRTGKLTRIELDDFRQHGLRLEGSSDDTAFGLVYQAHPDVSAPDGGPGKLFRIRPRR